MMDAMGSVDFQALDGRAIRRELGGLARRIVSLEVVEETGSTNDRLLCRADVAAGFHVCLAESQTAGRGRRGRRTWYSPKSGSLYLSVLHRDPAAQPRQSAWLSLAAATEVVSALAAAGVAAVGVKWPNDIYCNGRKLGGVLAESKGDRCVVGLGLNVHFPAAGKPESDAAWVALDEIGRGGVDRQQLASSMITAVASAFDRVEHDTVETLMKHWRQCDLLADREVTVLTGKGSLAGVARGVDEHGGLRVEHNSGDGSGMCVYYSNEVSVRW